VLATPMTLYDVAELRRLGPEEVATLLGNAFIGSEALLLLGFDRQVVPIRSALRRVGVLIRELEER